MEDDPNNKVYMGTEHLPEVSLDLRIIDSGETLLKIDGRPLHGVQSLKVEMEAESMIPKVTISFTAKQVRLDLPHANLTTERPVVMIPALSWDKKSDEG